MIRVTSDPKLTLILAYLQVTESTTTTTSPVYSHTVGTGEGKMYAVHNATSEEVERLFLIEP